MTDFGTVKFTSTSATDSSGHTGSISDSAWQAASVALTPEADSMGFGESQFAETTSGGSGAASPSGLSSDGSGFSVAYSADASTTSTSTATGGYGGYGGTSGYGEGYGGYGYGGYGSYGGGGYGADGYGDSGYGYGSITTTGSSYVYTYGPDGWAYYAY